MASQVNSQQNPYEKLLLDKQTQKRNLKMK